MLNSNYNHISRNSTVENRRLSPNEYRRRYIRQLDRLRAQARRMENDLVARAIADLIRRVVPGRTE